MKGVQLFKKQSMYRSKAKYGAAALSGAMLAYKNDQFREEVQRLACGPLKANECATAEEQAADLEKIFKESGGMLSQEELMELIMKKKNTLKPLPFEKVGMQYLGVYKQTACEVRDGLNFGAFLPLGNNFQLGGQWQLSNGTGAAFEITSAINNASPTSSQDDVQSAVFKFLSDGSGMVLGSLNLPGGVMCQTQTMFNDATMN